MYSIYYPEMGKKNWGKGLFDKLFSIATQDPALKRFDYQIKTEKPVVLFPNRHSTKETSFIVDSSMNEQEIYEKCDKHIDKLLGSTKSSKKQKKSKDKTDANKNLFIIPITPALVSKPNTTQFLSRYSPGFITSKTLRTMILHHFLLYSFSSKPFTVNDIFSLMPVELYYKLIGDAEVPNEFIKEPKLRHILISCFPRRIKSLMINHTSTELLTKMLKSMCKPKLMVLQENNEVYHINIVHSRVILDVGLSDNFICKSIEMLWRYIEALDIKENLNKHSIIISKKRWTIGFSNANYARHNTMLKNVIISIPNISKYFNNEELTKQSGFEHDFLSRIVDKNNKVHKITINELLLEFNNIKIVTLFDYTHIEKQEKDINLDFFVYSWLTPAGIIIIPTFSWKEINKQYQEFQNIANRMRFRRSLRKTEVMSYIKYNICQKIAEIYTGDDEINESKMIHWNMPYYRQRYIPCEIGLTIEYLKRYIVHSKHLSLKRFRECLLQCRDYTFADTYTFLLIINFIVKGALKRITGKDHSVKSPRVLLDIRKFYDLLYEISNSKKDKLNCEINFGSSLCVMYFPMIEFKKKYIIEHPLSISFLRKNSMFRSIFSEHTFETNIYLKRLMLPKLMDFEIPIEKTKPLLSNDLLEKDIFIALEQAFKEIFEIFIQIEARNLYDFAILVYTFIIHSHYEGLNIKQLCDLFSIEQPSLKYAQLMKILLYLQQFQFIYKLHTCFLIPTYCADKFVRPALIGHYWIMVNGKYDSEVILKTRQSISEWIEFNPGIKFDDLCAKFKHLCVNDIIFILESLELDEIIYSSFSIAYNGGIFDESIDVPIPSDIIHSNLMIMLEEMDVMEIRYYPTKHSFYNSTLAFM